MVGEILLGAFLGFVSGLAGAGGAALALPGMIFLLGTPAVTAVATAFPFTAITKVFGSVQHIRQGSVHWGTTLDILIGSLPGALAGVFIISALVDRFGDDLNDLLKVVIGVLLLGSTIASYFIRQPSGEQTIFPRGRNVRGIVSAVFCGVVIGGTSVGGGSLLMVVMLMFYFIPPAQLVGTSMVVSVALMAAGTLAFWSEGLADLTLAWHMAVGGVPGVILGSMMTTRVSPIVLGRVITAVIAVAGISLIVRGLAG